MSPSSCTFKRRSSRLTFITRLFLSAYMNQRLFHRITTLAILRLLLPCINQCLRHMFVSFYCFLISPFVSAGVTPYSIQYWMIIWWNSLSSDVAIFDNSCTYKNFLFRFFMNLYCYNAISLRFYQCLIFENTILVWYNKKASPIVSFSKVKKKSVRRWPIFSIFYNIFVC